MSTGSNARKAAQADGFGSGVLSRAAALVYTHLVIGVLLCAGSSPTVALLLLLERSASNVPLVPLCFVLSAPALSAALFALHEREPGDELAPARRFLRGLRLGWSDALRVWTPAMAALSLISGGMVSLDDAGIPAAYAGILLTLGVLFLLWGVNALLIATFFSFRWRDTARLAAFYIGRRWSVTLGELALLTVAVATVFFTTEAVLWLFQVVWISFLVIVARPLIADVTTRFTKT
ncbi:glycosyltransferase [Microbacterium sp. G2-8]|uniref:glycosyltransferase n=1 Tax=Microbacterium sp. G2-8 TaxID=2842454 RepID=UPI001C8A07C2|nr:glycosyltransferase [Microbacterium sp. G2-8]